MRTTINRLGLSFLLIPALLVGGCITESEPLDSGAGDDMTEVEASESLDEAALMDLAEADENEGESEDGSMGQGMQHRYMQDMMHEEMLRKAVEMEIFSEEDAQFFGEAHAKMEPFQPEGASPAMGAALDDEGHRAMQRAVTNTAVAEGALSDAEADRFTELHDLLIENGLMNEDSSMGMEGGMAPSMGRGMGANHARMQAAMHDAMLSEALEGGFINEADAALFKTVHAAIEPYQPDGAMEGGGAGMALDIEGKKAMQRAIVNTAVAEGAVSEADALRFTEIHDLLLDEGIMAAYESDE